MNNDFDNNNNVNEISRIVRIRKTEMNINGEIKVIVMIRDLSDSFNFEKI